MQSADLDGAVVACVSCRTDARHVTDTVIGAGRYTQPTVTTP